MSQLKNIKLSTPTYNDVVPSTKKHVKLKPFRVGDEKTLLIASESKDSVQMINALKSVIANCVDGINVDELAFFDLEYLFLKLRSVSVGETTLIGLPCEHCNETNRINVDLTKVKVHEAEGHSNIVKVNDDITLEMKYPEVEVFANVGRDMDSILMLVAHSVKTLFYGDEAITITEAEIEDLKEILLGLTTKQFESVQEFFTTIPKLKHELKFKCTSCKEDNSHTLEGLTSFF